MELVQRMYIIVIGRNSMSYYHVIQSSGLLRMRNVVYMCVKIIYIALH